MIEHVRRLPRNWQRLATAWAAGALMAFGFSSTAFASDGTLDPSFGVGGLVINDLGSGDPVKESRDGLVELALQDDDKIVGVGIFRLVRFNADGSLDSTFGTGGQVDLLKLSPLLDRAVAVQPDGKIIVGGQSALFEDFMVARFNPDGSLDTSFGNGQGFVTTLFPSSGSTVLSDLAVGSDGKIVAVGTTITTNESCTDFAVARYNPDGSLDTSFDGDGRAETTISAACEVAREAEIQADGKIVVAGSDFLLGFVAARFRDDGTLDPSFDGDGMVTTVLPLAMATALAIQPDGAIVIAGTEQGQRFTLVRYRSNGALDTSFGNNGIVRAFSGFITDIALRADGRIVVTGILSFPIAPDITLARFHTNGSVDTTFGTNGIVRSNFGKSEIAVSLRIQTNGRIVAGGSRTEPSTGASDWALAGYTGTP